jgi:uncharacterized lipoprotein YmbA
MRLRLAHLPICLAALLGACATTQPDSFYTLNPVSSSANAGKNAAPASYSVSVGPVHVPEAVDRPQLVVRQGANRVEILEQHRWSQPLPAEIAQALAAGLAARLPQARVLYGSGNAGPAADYRVAVDVTRFDAVAGEAVVVEVVWSIRGKDDKAPLVGQSQVREVLQGKGYDEVAARFAMAVMRVSDDIAAHVRSSRTPAAKSSFTATNSDADPNTRSSRHIEKRASPA